MASKKKTYFIADRLDYNYPDGPIKLGNIAADISSATRPLNSASFTIPQDDSYQNRKYNWSNDRIKAKHGVFGIFARFGQLFKGEASFDFSRDDLDHYEFAELETQYFVPGDDYVKERLRDEVLQKSLVERKKPVVMIVGLMIAHKPKAETTSGRTIKTKVEVRPDVAGHGQLGPKAQYDDSKKEGVSFKDGDTIVFAVAYRKIWYKVKEDNTIEFVKAKDKEGGWYSAGAHQSDEQEEDNPEPRPMVATLLESAPVEAKDRDSNYQAEELQGETDDEVFECVWRAT